MLPKEIQRDLQQETYTHNVKARKEGQKIYQGQVLNYLVQMLPALRLHGFLPFADHFHTHLDPQGSSFWKPELDCCPRS